MGTFDDLKDLDQEWEATEIEERSGDFGPEMPDGPQQALLTALEIRVRQSDDHRQLFMRFQNRRGIVRDWRDLDAENGMGLKIAKGDLQTLGYEGKISELPAWLASMAWEGLVCNINKKTKPGDTRDFTDVFLNGCMGKASDPDIWKPDLQQAVAGGGNEFIPDFAPAAADDDIPFAFVDAYGAVPSHVEHRESWSK